MVDWTKLARVGSNALGDIGYGLTQGTNLQQSLAAAGQRTQAMEAPRAAAELQAKAEQDRRAAIEQEQQKANQTAQWLAAQGSTDLAEAINMGALDGGSAFKMHYERKLAPKDAGLINAGGGNIYDPNSGQWIQAPGGGASALPESVVALQERARLAGLEPGSPQYSEFMMSGGRSGTSLSVGPDGTVTFNQGAGLKLTEQQAKDNVYSIRAQGVSPILDQFENELTNVIARGAGADPTGVVRGMLQSPQYQQAEQAGREFLASVLRKDTGAAVTPQEFDMYGKMFLPQPGDSTQVIAQKRGARARAIRAINQGLPPALVIQQAGAIDGPTGASPIDALLEKYR